jgi:hypothetical protein
VAFERWRSTVARLREAFRRCCGSGARDSPGYPALRAERQEGIPRLRRSDPEPGSAYREVRCARDMGMKMVSS